MGHAERRRGASARASDSTERRGASATMRKRRPLCLPRAPSFALRARFTRCAGAASSGPSSSSGFAAFALALLRSALRRVSADRGLSRHARRRCSRAQLGQPVEIAALATGWDGWNPKLVVEGLRVLDRARASPSPLLELPEVEMIVAWTSLPLLELRLKELVIDGPRLAIRRDRAGMLRIAGLEFDPDAGGATTCRSPTGSCASARSSIRDALITWDDDLRNAPQLVLDRVQFRLENRFGHHRFGLEGTPPADLAAPLDLRGDLRIGSIEDWQNAPRAALRAPRLRRCRGVARMAAVAAADRERQGRAAHLVRFRGRRSARDRRRPRARRRQGEARRSACRSSTSRTFPAVPAWRKSRRRSASSSREASRSRRSTASGSTRPTSRCTGASAAASGPSPGSIEFDRLQLAPLRRAWRAPAAAERMRADLARFAPRGTLTHGRLRWAGDHRSADRVSSGRRIHATSGSSRRTHSREHRALRPRSRPRRTAARSRSRAPTSRSTCPASSPLPLPFDTLQSVVKWERRDGNDEGEASSSSSSRTRMSSGERVGNLPHGGQRTRRDRHRRARVARRCAAGFIATCRERSTRPRGIGSRAALVSGSARRCAPQARRQSRRFPVCQRQGRQVHVHARRRRR